MSILRQSGQTDSPDPPARRNAGLRRRAVRALFGVMVTALILGACTAATGAGDSPTDTGSAGDETGSGADDPLSVTAEDTAGAGDHRASAEQHPPDTLNPGATVDPPAPDPVGLTSLAVSGGTGAMYPAFAADVRHYALTCDDSPTLGVVAETDRDGAQLTLLRSDPADSAVSTTGTLNASVTVDEDHDVAIEVSAGDDTATYVVHCLPAAFPTVNILTRTDQVKDGLLLLTPTYGGYHDRVTFMAVLDNNGVPRFHRLLTGANFWAMNFQPHGGGRFSLSRRPLLNLADSAFGNWQIDLLDGKLEVTATVTTASPLSHTDGHDFQISADGHYVMLSYYDDELRDFSEYGGSPSQRTRDSVIQRRTADGESQFTWNSWDHRDVLQVGTDCTVGIHPDTYAHLNGLQLLSDGDFVASFRGCSQVLRIDGSTGAVEWKLGGTAPGGESDVAFLELADDPDAVEEFCGQHHVTLTSSKTVVLYDNGVQCIGARKEHAPFSRAVEYDISSGTHAVYKREYQPPAGQGYFPYRGGVHVLDGFGGKVHWLISWGGSAAGRTVAVERTIAVSEVDPDTGTAHLEVNMVMDSLDAWSYRVYRVPEDALDLSLNVP